MGVKRTVYNWEEREGEGESERESESESEREKERERASRKGVRMCYWKRLHSQASPPPPPSLGTIVSPVHTHRYYQE